MAQAREPQAEALRRLLRARRLRGPFPPHGSRPPRRIRPGGAPVLDDSSESITKTAKAVKLLQEIGAYADIEKVKASRNLRSGKGKMRNRRYVQRKGPLVVYANDSGITKAMRNIPGVELCSVDRLGLLTLAPGGHVGRFIIWTKSAFEKLDAIYGTSSVKSSAKKLSLIHI